MSDADKDLSFVSAGMGVPRAVAEPVCDLADGELSDTPQAETDEQENPIWSDKPTYSDQWWRFPETCKTGPLTTAVFKLSSPTDLEKLNALMGRTVPESAPGIAVAPGGSVEWSEKEGTYVELVKYKKIQYKRLIKKQS